MSKDKINFINIEVKSNKDRSNLNIANDKHISKHFCANDYYRENLHKACEELSKNPNNNELVRTLAELNLVIDEKYYRLCLCHKGYQERHLKNYGYNPKTKGEKK